MSWRVLRSGSPKGAAAPVADTTAPMTIGPSSFAPPQPVPSNPPTATRTTTTTTNAGRTAARNLFIKISSSLLGSSIIGERSDGEIGPRLGQRTFLRWHSLEAPDVARSGNNRRFGPEAEKPAIRMDEFRVTPPSPRPRTHAARFPTGKEARRIAQLRFQDREAAMILPARLILRTATPDDAEAAAPLLYSADQEVWDFIFAHGGTTATAYLADAFRQGTGLWGPKTCAAAVLQERVIGVAAVWTPAEYPALERQTLRHIRSYYGPLSAAQVVLRSLLVGRHMPPPKGNVAYLAALGVADDLRGRGVGTALLNQVMAEARTRGCPP